MISYLILQKIKTSVRDYQPTGTDLCLHTSVRVQATSKNAQYSDSSYIATKAQSLSICQFFLCPTRWVFLGRIVIRDSHVKPNTWIRIGSKNIQVREPAYLKLLKVRHLAEHHSGWKSTYQFWGLLLVVHLNNHTNRRIPMIWRLDSAKFSERIELLATPVCSFVIIGHRVLHTDRSHIANPRGQTVTWSLIAAQGSRTGKGDSTNLYYFNNALNPIGDSWYLWHVQISRLHQQQNRI